MAQVRNRHVDRELGGRIDAGADRHRQGNERLALAGIVGRHTSGDGPILAQDVGMLLSATVFIASRALEIPFEMVSTSISNTSISAKALNSTALPSITGFPARLPTLPSPRTAVPSVMSYT